MNYINDLFIIKWLWLFMFLNLPAYPFVTVNSVKSASISWWWDRRNRFLFIFQIISSLLLCKLRLMLIKYIMWFEIEDLCLWIPVIHYHSIFILTQYLQGLLMWHSDIIATRSLFRSVNHVIICEVRFWGFWKFRLNMIFLQKY